MMMEFLGASFCEQRLFDNVSYYDLSTREIRNSGIRKVRKNTIQFQFLSDFMPETIRILRFAIKGQSGPVQSSMTFIHSHPLVIRMSSHRQRIMITPSSVLRPAIPAASKSNGGTTSKTWQQQSRASAAITASHRGRGPLAEICATRKDLRPPCWWRR